MGRQNSASLRALGWDLKYKFNPDRSHELEFAAALEMPIDRMLTTRSFSQNEELVHPKEHSVKRAMMSNADDARDMDAKMASLKKKELATQMERQMLSATVEPQIKEAHNTD